MFASGKPKKDSPKLMTESNFCSTFINAVLLSVFLASLKNVQINNIREYPTTKMQFKFVGVQTRLWYFPRHPNNVQWQLPYNTLIFLKGFTIIYLSGRHI